MYKKVSAIYFNNNNRWFLREPKRVSQLDCLTLLGLHNHHEAYESADWLYFMQLKLDQSGVHKKQLFTYRLRYIYTFQR